MVTCGDKALARKRLLGNSRYDLLVVDNHVPHGNGLGIVRYARQLAHRWCMPIIMLSASEVEAEARKADADAFLRKLHDIARLAATVQRLLYAGE